MLEVNKKQSGELIIIVDGSIFEFSHFAEQLKLVIMLHIFLFDFFFFFPCEK